MKSVIHIYSLLFCIIYSFSSCVGTKQKDLLQDIKLNFPMENVLPEEYRIIPGDQLTIVVYAWDKETAALFSSYAPRSFSQGNNDRTEIETGREVQTLENANSIKPVTVYADGTITFPYIGKVYVQGSTILEARRIISEKLSEFSEGTAADVTLANKYFSIIGEGVANRILMTGTSMTIYQALAVADPIGDFGDKSKATIIRQTADGSTVKTFDLRSQEIVNTDFYYIQPNDVIYIPQMKRKFLGATTFPTLFSLTTSLASVIVLTLRVF